MKIKYSFVLLIVLIFSSCYNLKKNITNSNDATTHFEPTPKSLQQYKTPDWFKDAKFGIWNVWGPYSVPAVGEWYARNMYIMDGDNKWQIQGPHHRKVWGDQSEFGYKDFIPMWKAEKFDPNKLMEQYKKAGAKYYTSIATFHDNYDLFDSKHTRWNSVQTGPKMDMVKAFQDAAHAQGLRYGATTHLARSLNWWTVNKGTPKEPYDGSNPEYYDLYHPPYDYKNPDHKHIADEWGTMWNKRIKDLIDNYELDLLYFDGGIPFGKKGYDVVSHFYNNNLKRHNGTENGVMCIKGWPKESGKEFSDVALMDYERKKSGELKVNAWQTDDHMGSWGYNQFAKYRPTNYIVDKLIDIVSKNGNLLLCLPLKADGTHPEPIDTFLDEMGQWMALNGEAIYGTRPWKIYGEGPIRKEAKNHGDMANEERMDEKDIRFTTKGSQFFAFQLGWPQNGRMVIKALGKNAKNNSKTIKKVTMVGTGKVLDFTQNNDQLTIKLPVQHHCEHAFAVNISFK